MNSARYFIRREDDEPPRTPSESPFRKFDAKCLKCGSYQSRRKIMPTKPETVREVAL